MNTETTDHEASAQHDERYLLGHLDEREIERLEHGLLERPARLEQLEAAEAELIDRYVREELSSEDRNRFERRLLPSARIRERVKTARSLRRLAKQTNGDRTPRAADTESGRIVPWGRRTVNGNGGGGSPVSSRLAWAACLVVLLATGFLSLLNLRLQDRLDRTRMAHRQAVEKALSAEERAEEMAEAVEQAEGRAAEFDRLQTELADREKRIETLENRIDQATSDVEAASSDNSGKARSIPGTALFLALTTRSSEPQRIQLPVEGDEIRLELGLGRIQPEGELMITVRRSGLPVWKESGVEPVFAGPEGMVPVTLPEELLLPGTYEIEVTEFPGRERTTLASFDFKVQP